MLKSILLLIAGHETTVNLIGNGMLALLKHPDELVRLYENPGLLGTAVEELLRFDSPIQVTFRTAAEDITLHGQTIKKGQQVGLFLGSANRDPAQFANPNRLNIARRPNKHSAFGMGVHVCLGAPLARLEAEIAVSTLLKQLPNMKLAAETPKWRPGIGSRGLEVLPVLSRKTSSGI